MRSPRTRTSPGVTIFPDSMSSRRAAWSTIGRGGVCAKAVMHPIRMRPKLRISRGAWLLACRRALPGVQARTKLTNLFRATKKLLAHFRYDRELRVHHVRD